MSEYPIDESGLKRLKQAYYTDRTRYDAESPDDRLFQTNGNHWEDFEYFPHWHYGHAIDGYERLISGHADNGDDQEPARRDRLGTSSGETLDDSFRADGGYRKTVYFWLDPDTDAALYHTGVYDDEADPFFDNVVDAERYLEQRAAHTDTNRYEGLSLYKARISKVEDAIEVLMDQSGLDDFERFVSDGGRTDDLSEAELYEAGSEMREFGKIHQETAAAEEESEQVDFSEFHSDQPKLGGSGEG